jgi:antitoxin PrlF
MASTTLTSKGQVTIPKEIRELLGIKEGDRLVFRLDEQGKVVLQPEETGPLGRLPGLLHHLAGSRPASIEEMKEAVQRRMRRKFRPTTE